MSHHSAKFNALPFDLRKVLCPVMDETRVRDLKSIRAELVRSHKRQLRELDDLIKRIERSIEEFESSQDSASD